MHLEAARKAGLPIIYSAKDNRNSDSVVNVNATQRKRKGTDDGNSYEIHPELAPAGEDLMVFKERASCFFGIPLVTYLHSLLATRPRQPRVAQVETVTLLSCTEQLPQHLM